MKIQALTMLCALLCSSAAEAITKNIQVCFRTATSNYVDSARRALSDGTLEDYWVTNSNQRLRGAYVTVKHGTTTVWSGYTGDSLGSGDPGAGCTDRFSISTSSSSIFLSYDIQSKGSVNSNFIYIRNNSEGNALRTYHGTFSVCSDPIYCTALNADVDLTFTDSNGRYQAMWAAYASSAYALFRHNGGNAGQAFSVWVTTSDGNYYSPTDLAVHLMEGDAYEKFTTVHELGHRMTHLRVGSGPFGYCDGVDNDALCPESAGNHSMGSEELADCAFTEALAHFYAADVWNSHSEFDGNFQYYKEEFGSDLPAVDLEAPTGADRSMPLVGGSAPFPAPFIDQCGSPSSLANHGVEVDWLRVLWDVHTNTNNGTPPSFTTMMDWMHDAWITDYPWDNAYTELDYESSAYPGSLEDNWNAAKIWYSINHP